MAQLVDVRRYLRGAGIEAVVGPPLNIGITNEAGDWTRDDPTKNPNGMGGLPFTKTSAAVGKTIAEYRTRYIGDTIKLTLADKPPMQN